MPYIPDLHSVQGQWAPSTPDPGVAALPGAALANVGRAVLGAADDVTAIGLRVKAVRYQDGMNQARLQFARAKAEHSDFRMRTPDQTQWSGNLTAAISSARQRLGTLNVSPGAKQQIDTEWQTWEADALNQTNLDATKFEITRARQAETNLVEGYLDSKDFESARRVKRGSTLNSPEFNDADVREIDKAEKDWQTRAAEQATLDAIAADPLGSLERLTSNPPPTTADDATKAAHARQLHAARQAQGAVNQEVTQSIRDGMVANGGQAPAITTAEQIDTLAAHASPTVREILKGELADLTDAGRKATMRTPTYQKQLVGTVAEMIDSFDPDDSEAAIQISSLLRDMDAGPVKNHYSEALSAQLKPDTATPDGDWVLKYGLDGIAQIEKDGVFGKVPKAVPVATEKALNNGALNSIGNLTAAGFSAAQAKAIARAKDKAGKVTQASQLAAYRDAWTQRGTPPKDADPFVLATMTAIGEGASTISVDDPKAAAKDSAALWAIRAKSGSVRAEIIKWRKRNPKADDKAIHAEIIRLSGTKADAAWDEPLDLPDDDGMVLPLRDD